MHKPVHPKRLMLYQQRTALRIYRSGGQVKGSHKAQEMVPYIKRMHYAMLYGASPQTITRVCGMSPLFTYPYSK